MTSDIIKIMNKISHDSETLKEGQQVITACAFIYHKFEDGIKVFLPKRADTKKFLPGVYELPGGHIDFGEDIEVGLKREIFEEFGMDIKVHDPFAAFTYRNEIKKSHSIEVVYFAEFINPIGEIKINPEDHSEFVWISEGEIDKIISNNKNSEDQEIKVIRKGFEKLR
jgi:8-oxo-dGTP diphosphatase